jgi:hypothetical protein
MLSELNTASSLLKEEQRRIRAGKGGWIIAAHPDILRFAQNDREKKGRSRRGFGGKRWDDVILLY